MLTLQELMYIEEMIEPTGPFGTIPQESCILGAKVDHAIKLKRREVHTHASYKTTRTWENSNNQGTK